jgi:hypothetical protein
MGEAKRKREQFRAAPQSCAYCGKTPAPTRDHVPPKSAFSKPYPANLITVPSCEDCNSKYSELDEEFRIGLSLLAAEQTPQAQYLWRKHTLPGVRKNQRLRRLLVSSISDHKVWLRSPITGRFERYHTVSWPANTYQAMIERVTRGLYFKEVGAPLLLETPVDAMRVKDFKGVEQFARFNAIRSFAVGRTIQFEYAFVKTDDNPLDTFWIYIFQGAECAFAATGGLAERDRSGTSLGDAGATTVSG